MKKTKHGRKPLKQKAAPLWRHPARMARYYHLRLMRLEASPEAIAKGLAGGVFVGSLPIVPFHMVSALGLAFIFRANKPAALLGTLVSNPLDMVPHYLLLYYIGHRILPLAAPAFDPEHIDLRTILSEGWELLAILMTGGIVVAIPASLAAYFICLGAVKKYRARSGR